MSRPKKPPNLWFPTLLQTANGINIESHSWFNIKKVENDNKNSLNKQTINTSFVKTKKYIILESSVGSDESFLSISQSNFTIINLFLIGEVDLILLPIKLNFFDANGSNITLKNIFISKMNISEVIMKNIDN